METFNLTLLQGNQALVMLDTGDVHIVQTLSPPHTQIPLEMQQPQLPQLPSEEGLQPQEPKVIQQQKGEHDQKMENISTPTLQAVTELNEDFETITFDVTEALEAFIAEDSNEDLFKELESPQEEQVPPLGFMVQNPPENLKQAAVDQQHLYPVKATAYPWMEALCGCNWVEPSLEKGAMQGSICNKGCYEWTLEGFFRPFFRIRTKHSMTP